MKKILIRAVSLMLCLLMAVPFFSLSTSAEKVTYRSGANGVSDAYKNSKYYKNLTSIELTGDGVTDVLAVALSQVEYVEGTSTAGFNGTQGGGGNFTEFNYNMGNWGVGYGGSSYSWCASFVSWCLLQSRCTDQNTMSAWCRHHMGDSKYIWREIGCPNWYKNLKQCGYGHDADSSYTPKSGDLVFFEGSGHIGIVRYYKDGTVYTIEGNTSNSSGLNPDGGGVYCKSYPRSYSKFLGFGAMPYKKNDKAMKVDYSGENPTTGLWIGETNKYLYPDTKMSDSSNYSVIPKGTIFEVIEIVNKTCFKAKYDGKTGYVNVNNTSKIYQVTSSAPPEPPVEKNTYYIDKDIKKISGHFGSGIDKYYVDTKGSTKAKTSYDLKAGQKIGIEGFAGFDSFAKSYGYYFDGNSGATVWDSSPIDADADAKKKGGDKATEFKIMADTSNLTNGEHTVTFAIKLLNKKEHPLITLKLNITGAGENVGQETLPPDDQQSEDISDMPDVTEDDAGCADDMETSASEEINEPDETDENGESIISTSDETKSEDGDTKNSAKDDAKKDETTPTVGVGCAASVGLITAVPAVLTLGAVVLKKKKED